MSNQHKVEFIPFPVTTKKRMPIILELLGIMVLTGILCWLYPLVWLLRLIGTEI